MSKFNRNQIDFRIESLKLTLDGLSQSLKKLRSKHEESDCSDGIWLLEISEPIIGSAFISLQNYINSSIYDRFETLDKQYEKYKLGNYLNNTKRTDIELIIGLANYFKHRDDHGNLFRTTTKILSDVNLKFDKEIDITSSPIIRGFDLISKNWDLMILIKIVKQWRIKLWC
jgi:hypothetical protein